MGNIITIIVLIAVVWQIISAIIAHTQQQKEREHEMEARRQRAASMAKRGTKPTGPTSSAPPVAAGQTDQPPAISAKQSKLDELAARRQQQLDELRRRRESGRQPATSQGSTGIASDRGSASEWESSTQLRTSHTSIGAGSPVIVPPSRSRESSPGMKQRQLQEQQQRARQQARQQREQQLAQRRQREADAAAKPSPYAAGEIGAAAARRSEREAYITAAPAPPDQPVQRARIKELLHDRASLREVIVMKELLDPPVAMREPRWV